MHFVADGTDLFAAFVAQIVAGIYDGDLPGMAFLAEIGLGPLRQSQKTASGRRSRFGPFRMGYMGIMTRGAGNFSSLFRSFAVFAEQGQGGFQIIPDGNVYRVVPEPDYFILGA
jgi:hypothetical protein